MTAYNSDPKYHPGIGRYIRWRDDKLEVLDGDVWRRRTPEERRENYRAFQERMKEVES